LKLAQQKRDQQQQYNCLGQSIFAPTIPTYVTAVTKEEDDDVDEINDASVETSSD
jgi:L-lactate utilization protein LutB